MAQTDRIAIKGTRDGLQVTLGTGELDELLVELGQRLGEQGRFFEGARVIIQAGERVLAPGDLTGLQVLLAQHNMTLWAVLGDSEDTRTAARQLGLATRLGGSRPAPAEPAEGPVPGTVPAFMRDERGARGEPGGAASIPQLEDGVAGMFIRRTLRSGKSVRYAGAIVVIGDVNPGAEIIAGGDVIVWGKLRGVVHAGAMGDESAVVCALEMAPTQLRIASCIAIAPDEPRKRRPALPELARVQAGRIVVEGWKA